jgi:Flp pilus assembly protein CpaB
VRGRSNLLVVLGIAFFVVGGIIVFLLTDDDDGGGSSRPVPVVVSSVDVEAGTLANDLIDQGRLREVKVPADQLVPGAIQSVNQLKDATFVQGFAANQQLTSGGLQLQNRTFEVPAGFEAVAIQVDFVAGGAGYVNPGDFVNLYGTYDTQYPLDQPVPRAQLLLSNVQVLDVDLTVPPRRGTSSADPNVARTSTDSVTFLLALQAPDAEKVIYNTEFQGLYASLVAKDAPPVSGTPGRAGDNILAA